MDLPKKDDITIRQGLETDLPTVHTLIMDSFLALLDHIGGAYRPMVVGAATSICARDLSVDKFHENFNLLPGYSFWVAVENSSGFVVGCIGVRRRSQVEAELVYMAVSPALRGGGIGTALLNKLSIFCEDTGVKQIVLHTLNPDFARFYKRNGFRGHGVKLVRDLMNRRPREVHANEVVGYMCPLCAVVTVMYLLQPVYCCYRAIVAR